MDTSALIAQREELDKRIEEAKRTERVDAMKTIRNLMDTYGITPAELSRKEKGKVPVKWIDPKTGTGWTGRGKTPKWFDPATAIKA